MKVYIKEINCCEDCPNYKASPDDETFEFEYFCCGVVPIRKVKCNKFPYWCPLKEIKDEVVC